MEWNEEKMDFLLGKKNSQFNEEKFNRLLGNSFDTNKILEKIMGKKL